MTVAPVHLRIAFYGVLNTKEKAGEVAPLRSDEILHSYSWCETREDVGQAARPAARLVAEVERLDRYTTQGDIRRQEIPARIRTAVQQVRAGLDMVMARADLGA